MNSIKNFLSLNCCNSNMKYYYWNKDINSNIIPLPDCDDLFLTFIDGYTKIDIPNNEGLAYDTKNNRYSRDYIIDLNIECNNCKRFLFGEIDITTYFMSFTTNEQKSSNGNCPLCRNILFETIRGSQHSQASPSIQCKNCPFNYCVTGSGVHRVRISEFTLIYTKQNEFIMNTIDYYGYKELARHTRFNSLCDFVDYCKKFNPINHRLLK